MENDNIKLPIPRATCIFSPFSFSLYFRGGWHEAALSQVFFFLGWGKVSALDTCVSGGDQEGQDMSKRTAWEQGRDGKATVFLFGFLKTGIRVGGGTAWGKVVGANPSIK